MAFIGKRNRMVCGIFHSLTNSLDWWCFAWNSRAQPAYLIQASMIVALFVYHAANRD